MSLWSASRSVFADLCIEGRSLELITCRSCGLPIPARAGACWRCDYPIIYSLAVPVHRDGGLSELAEAVVAVAVFAVVLGGMVTFHARSQSITEAVGPAPSPPPAVVAGAVPTAVAIAHPASTPVPTPKPAVATPAPTPLAVLPAEAAVLDRGGWAVVSADDVVIRTQPYREEPSQIIGSYDAGSYVEILDGPVVGSGYYWFFVGGDGPTGWIAAGTGAGAWLVGAETPGTVAGLPSGTVVVSGAEIVYYDITGTTPAQLREQISRFGPDSEPGSDVIATAEFVPEWVDVPVTETTDIGGVSTTSSYYACDVAWHFEVTVPRWVGPASAPQATVAWWHTALERIVEHEATHVRIWQDALPSLQARLQQQVPCYEAIILIDDWLHEVDINQAAFDADHGYLDWPSAPSMP